MKTDLTLQVAQALVSVDTVGFVPDAPIRFKSGILSPIYIDNRRLPYHPRQWHIVIGGFQALIERESLTFEGIAGVAVGGVLHSSALAYSLNCPSVFIRQEAKEHGTKKRVEGGDVAGRRVVLVEDLVTTGGSSLYAVASLRDAGANVSDVLAIVSYGFAEARQAFKAVDVRLYTLTDFETIIQIAQQMDKLQPDAMEIISDWFRDPHEWAARRGFS